MRAAMCFTHFQHPRCQIHTLCGSWWKKVNNLSKSQEIVSNFRLLGPNINGLQGGNGGRWTRKSVSTNAEGKNILSRKTSSISQQITDVSSLTHSGLDTCRVDLDDSKRVHIQQKDLSGGVNSTFQTLVNPDRFVANSNIHGISDHMVKKIGVPRMKEFIPVFLQYVRSRQKPGGQILFIAHNAKTFDVPFLMSEFSRCSYEIPSDWRFVDSLYLARELKEVKQPEGAKRTSRSLQTLREHYEIPLIGNAHRAMADVNVLALVLQKMTRDLKLTIPCLLENYSFTAADIRNNVKKKNSS